LESHYWRVVVRCLEYNNSRKKEPDRNKKKIIMPTREQEEPQKQRRMEGAQNNKDRLEKMLAEQNARVVKPLPDGWHEYHDKQLRSYYHNSLMNLTTWERPEPTVLITTTPTTTRTATTNPASSRREALELLIKAGCDVGLGAKKGMTPTFIAAERGQLTALELLIKAGCDVNRAAKDGRTPAFVAADREGAVDRARAARQGSWLRREPGE
jgi:hypothetical protein